MDNTQNTQMDLVYAMTNDLTNNQVIAFARAGDGLLARTNAYSTGGGGTGSQTVDPLSSQGSLISSPDGRYLYAVNAGSNTISSFAVSQSGALTLLGVVSSGGMTPNSLAMHGNVLYVTNSGTATNISTNVVGFKVGTNGKLTQIPGAGYMLSTADAKPACIVFNPDGTKLVVSELSTNQLGVYSVNRDGTLENVTYNKSNGAGPFGSMFLSNGVLLVAEAGANALSSYANPTSGVLNVISGSVPNGQSATCWVTATTNQQFAYTSNAGTGTISQYYVDGSGSLAAIANVSSTPQMNGAPLDSGTSKDGQSFYVLNGSQGSISMLQIQRDGTLMELQVLQDTGLPMIGAQGLVVL